MRIYQLPLSLLDLGEEKKFWSLMTNKNHINLQDHLTPYQP